MTNALLKTVRTLENALNLQVLEATLAVAVLSYFAFGLAQLSGLGA